MEILLSLVLLAVVFATLAYPFYRVRPRAFQTSTGTLNDLLAQRDGIYATLHDLDLDYQLGKLDAADYQTRREKYLARAGVLLRRLDALRTANVGRGDLGEEIERQVAALRQQTANLRAQPGDKKEQDSGMLPSGADSQQPSLTCRNCGRPYASGDQYCAKCGQALS